MPSPTSPTSAPARAARRRPGCGTRDALARPPRRRPAALAAIALLAACSARAPELLPAEEAPAQPARYRPDEVPRALAPSVARAHAAIRTFRERLLARQAAEIAALGPRRAIPVLHDAVPALAAAVSAQTGVEVGRTSRRPRAGADAPRSWATPFVAEAAGRRAADVPATVVDLGDRVAVLRPIAVTPACLGCHGGPDRVAPEVKAALDALYPADEATGLSEGDLAGFYWAEARK